MKDIKKDTTAPRRWPAPTATWWAWTRMTEALGLGMGCMDGTCGAVAGACILAGMKRSTGNLEKPDSKAESYKLSRAILGGFEKANGTAICKELKGIETGKVIKSCDDCIKEAAALAEQVLFS